jgi:hypothetical protein
MRTKRICFSALAASSLMFSCLSAPVFAQGGPGGGGGGGNGGGGGGGNTGITLARQLTDIWQASPTLNTFVRMTLNANGSFTSTETTTNTGKTTTVIVQGNWTLGPATKPQPFSNPQGLLTLTSRGQVLLSGNVLLIKPDLFQMFPTTNNISSFTPWIVFAKATP